jgi:enoyl-CoA hydratase
VSDFDDFTYIDVAVGDDRIAVATLNGPEAGNALTFAGQGELCELLPRISRDDGVDVLVVTGADAAFCSGPAGDFLERVGSGEPEFVRLVMERVYDNVRNLVEFEKPLVTAVNGPAHGAPLAMALLGDVIVAERHVTFYDHHVPSGVAAGDGNALIWPLAMGLVRAKRYLLTGDAFSADEAERMGLVTEVVDGGRSLERALDYARRFVETPQRSLRATKRAMNHWLRQALPVYERAWSAEVMTVFGSGPITLPDAP